VTRREMLVYSGILIILGAGWASTLSLTKIAVSTGHGVFGLIFWQLVIGAALMGFLTLIGGTGLPLTRVSVIFFTIIALIGTVIPNASSYKAVAHLPAGVISILMSMLVWVPLALVGSAFYAFEGNFVAKWGTGGLDAIQVLFGASLVGAALARTGKASQDAMRKEQRAVR